MSIPAWHTKAREAIGELEKLGLKKVIIIAEDDAGGLPSIIGEDVTSMDLVAMVEFTKSFRLNTSMHNAYRQQLQVMATKIEELEGKKKSSIIQ